jgi:hypothetical protein
MKKCRYRAEEIKKRDAKQRVFAMWVDNAEMLARWSK